MSEQHEPTGDPVGLPPVASAKGGKKEGPKIEVTRVADAEKEKAKLASEPLEPTSPADAGAGTEPTGPVTSDAGTEPAGTEAVGTETAPASRRGRGRPRGSANKPGGNNGKSRAVVANAAETDAVVPQAMTAKAHLTIRVQLPGQRRYFDRMVVAKADSPKALAKAFAVKLNNAYLQWEKQLAK